ncbi:MAG: cation:dicarboxylase symporter family transporter, partial [Bdellovibrionota bacterium]
EALQLLSNSIASSEDNLKGLPTTTEFTSIVAYIEDIIPVNIVKSIYDRNDIAIVIFSIVLGISLGITKNPHVPTAVSFFDAMFSAFLRYVNGLIYALPIALFFLMANFISQVGLSTLTSLFDLLLTIYASVFCIFMILSVIISRKTKAPFFKCFQYLKNPYLISFGTSSSFASMPAAMLALRDNFGVNKQNIELVLPLGISLFKPGIMVRSTVITAFLMSLYHVPFSLNNAIILMLTTIACSVASTAGPAILSATMFGMILSPLGIPPAIGIFLLLSIEPIIDPVCTMLNIQSNCTVTILVGK